MALGEGGPETQATEIAGYVCTSQEDTCALQFTPLSELGDKFVTCK